MEAYKCDRCGKLYAKTINGIWKKSDYSISYYNSLNKFRDLDLCDKCAGQFVKWIERFNVITQNEKNTKHIKRCSNCVFYMCDASNSLCYDCHDMKMWKPKED